MLYGCSITCSQSEVNVYVGVWRSEGFAYLNSGTIKGDVVQFCEKGGELVVIYVRKSINEVWVVV